MLLNGTSLNDLDSWVTSNPNFKVTIIQRQITRKWYTRELYLQWLTNSKSYMTYQTAPFSMTLNDPLPRFQGYAILWRWISQTVRDTLFQWNTNKDLDTPYSSVSFRMILNDHEWLSKIINDTQRRAVSLRQLSFLSSWGCCVEGIWKRKWR